MFFEPADCEITYLDRTELPLRRAGGASGHSEWAVTTLNKGRGEAITTQQHESTTPVRRAATRPASVKL